MQIKLIHTVTIGQRRYNPGELIDLEVDGKLKRELVDAGHAIWNVPLPPKEEKAIAKPEIEQAIVKKKDK